jgi:hypothetical protein
VVALPACRAKGVSLGKYDANILGLLAAGMNGGIGLGREVELYTHRHQFAFVH